MINSKIKTFNTETYKEVERLYAKGKGIKEIANKLGYSPSRISSALRTVGIRQCTHKDSKDRSEKIKNLKASGMTVKEIAKTLGIGETQIRNVLNEVDDDIALTVALGIENKMTLKEISEKYGIKFYLVTRASRQMKEQNMKNKDSMVERIYAAMLLSPNSSVWDVISDLRSNGKIKDTVVIDQSSIDYLERIQNLAKVMCANIKKGEI